MKYILPLDDFRVYCVIEENEGWIKGQEHKLMHEETGVFNSRSFSKSQTDWIEISKEQADRVISYLQSKHFY